MLVNPPAFMLLVVHDVAEDFEESLASFMLPHILDAFELNLIMLKTSNSASS